MVESYVATIFAQLARKQRYVSPARKGGLASANLGRVLQRIDEELDSNLSLKDLASLAGLSIPHFCRAFRQSTGFPPYALIIHRRIERAKALLRHSQMTITEVALVCGFSGSSHFSNIFRREVGTTPGEYRCFWQVDSSEVP
jgi:AraC-like DNA-binding protein